MERVELVETVNLMLDDAIAIIHNQQLLANIHTQLDRHLLFPHEQDYIFSDHYGQMPSEPRREVINGITVTSRILHQAGVGLRDIVGADLLYEIVDRKFGLIQYKRASSIGSVKNDRQQLETLLNNCPSVCMHKKNRPIPLNWLPLRINSFCGCWYCIIDGDERKYMHACEAEASFDNRTAANFNAFRIGIEKEAFLSMFASCRIGALIRRVPREGDISSARYVQPLLVQRHIVLEVRQTNMWEVAE